MSQITQLLPLENIILDLDASSKKRVFEHVGLLFENYLGIARSTVFDSLFAREKLGSTGLGQGVAIPHGRIKGLKDATGAFLRLAAPVAFDSPTASRCRCCSSCWCPKWRPSSTCKSFPNWRNTFPTATVEKRLAKAADASVIRQIFAG
jgi:PTS system nitrogen regulatory IIA component